MEVVVNEGAAPDIRTAVIPVTLSGSDHRRAHHAAHTSGLLWNQAVDRVAGEWKVGRSQSKYDIQRFLTALPVGDRPLHAQISEVIARDLADAIKTFRANRENGTKV